MVRDIPALRRLAGGVLSRLRQSAALWWSVTGGASLALMILAAELPKEGIEPGTQNVIALIAFGLATLGLWALYCALRVSGRFRPAAQPAGPLPRHVRWAAVVMALAWGLASLPPAFRLIDSPRALRVYSLDEPAMAERIQQYVSTPDAAPVMRLTQGWFTFLPVAYLCKAIDAVVPVNLSMINMLMRFYQLSVWCGVSYFAVILIWKMTGSAALSAAVVLAALWYKWVFDFSLRIDRPDGFNVLFIVLCLLSVLDLLARRDARSYYMALFWAALSFSARYVGMVMLPTIGAAFLWQQWESRRATRQAAAVKELARAGAFLAVSSGLIFWLVFVASSPYHLVQFKAFLEQMVYFSGVYRTGNAYNVPDYSPPPNIVLWWRTLTEAGTSDQYLAVLAGIGLLSGMIASVHAWRRGTFPPYSVMVIFTLSYGLFLIYQHGGEYVLYHYLFPVLPSIPYFAVLPLVLLCALYTRGDAGIPRPAGWRATAFVSGLMVVASLSIVLSARDRLRAAHTLLTNFRQTDAPEFAVGRFLEKHVPPDQNPRVLTTWWVYVPDRISVADIFNVSFTLKLVKEYDADYVIVSDNYYEKYAGKYATAAKNPIYPGYGVTYNDVVEAYTVFKERRHPDFELIGRVPGFDIFRRRRVKDDGSH